MPAATNLISGAQIGASQIIPAIVLIDPSTGNIVNIGQLQNQDANNLGSLQALLGTYVPLLLDAAGNFDRQKAAAGATGVPSVNTEGTRQTYSVGTVAFTPPATATDFFQIIGSGSKLVRVLRVQISGIATSAISVDIQAIKRTTANTGGTVSPLTIGLHDSTNGAVTAVVNTYSVLASPLGTGATIRAKKLNLGATGAAGDIVWDFTTRNGQGLVLRGVAQSLNLNWNGAAIPSGTLLDIDVEWTEE